MDEFEGVIEDEQEEPIAYAPGVSFMREAESE